MKKEDNIKLRIPKQIYQEMLQDLRRPHEYAFERIGFLLTKSKKLAEDLSLIVAIKYIAIDDLNYIDDKSVGARINSSAIRAGMQAMLEHEAGCFHVHLHDHSGRPSPSFTDMDGIPQIVESFGNIKPGESNGFLILSEDSCYAEVKLPGIKKYVTPQQISIIGYPIKSIFNKSNDKLGSEVFVRQSFLGKDSEFSFKNITVGIIGYGGGGSHVGQQLAHIGIKNIVVFDDDKIEYSNLNRLIGAWFSDIKKSIYKVAIAKRAIKSILPTAKVNGVVSRWQDNPEWLQRCDIVVGCVDSFLERQQLEAECRRYLIPLIDIGMDIHSSGEHSSMAGQIILSMPGSICMTCMGFLTDEKLAKEATKYGNVGGRPQVVWPNGVLASTAVGIVVDLITGWTKREDKVVYQSYDGNEGTISEHIRLRFADKECSHYLLSETGAPVFRKI